MIKNKINGLKEDIRNSVRTKDGADFWFGYLYALYDYTIINLKDYLSLKDYVYSLLFRGVK